MFARVSGLQPIFLGCDGNTFLADDSNTVLPSLRQNVPRKHASEHSYVTEVMLAVFGRNVNNPVFNLAQALLRLVVSQAVVHISYIKY